MKKHFFSDSCSIKNIFTFIFFSLSIISSNLTGQSESVGGIHGIVTDSETGKPIEYATVFLSNTSLGTLTNKNGTYVIKNIPVGTYNMVIALIGYNKNVKLIKISTGIQKIDVVLNVKPIIVKEITVTSETPLEWQRRLKKFTKEFLGESRNANDCEIINPEIIDFEVNKSTDELSASAQDAIVIVNQSLGYKIKAYLKDFVWSRSGAEGKYQIYPFFEELNTSDENEKNNWQANRAKTYKGSFRHFLKSCAEGKVYEEGFRYIKSSVSSKWIYKDKIDLLLNQKKMDLGLLEYPVIQKKSSTEYCMLYNSLLQVAYIGEGEEINYQDYFGRLTGKGSFSGRFGQNAKTSSYQSSWFLLPTGQLFFTNEGICSDESPYGKKLAGYWAWKRVGDLLPYDYKYSSADTFSK